MDALQWGELKAREHLGTSANGSTFLAELPGGRRLAVKWLEGSPEQIARVREGLNILATHPQAAAVAGMVAVDLESDPALLASEFIAAPMVDDGEAATSPAEVERGATWDVRAATLPLRERKLKEIERLLQALGSLHAAGLAHGNLKPSNVLMGTDGAIRLVDWGVSAVRQLDQGPVRFDAAMLFMPPERLRAMPERLSGELSADVHAFGVLAYHWLCGRFPRCHEAFAKVMPEIGQTARPKLRADPAKIARNLERSSRIDWPRHPHGPDEAKMRTLIESCLELDPQLRPADLAVAANHYFRKGSGVGIANAPRESNEFRTPLEATPSEDFPATEDHFGDPGGAGKWVLGAALLLLLAGGGYVGMRWVSTEQELGKERWKRLTAEAQRIEEVHQEKETLKISRSASEAVLRNAINDREIAQAHLVTTRRMSDRLFAWAMDARQGEVPPLEGADERAVAIEKELLAFTNDTIGMPELANERARALMQLAELALAGGRTEVAAERLEVAIAAARDDKDDPGWMLRAAADRLWLGLRKLDDGDADAPAILAATRATLAGMDRDGADGDRVTQLLALLDLHEAKWEVAAGRDTEALEMVLRGTQALNHLAATRPDAAALRSELASAYLQSASLLEATGKFDDAEVVRDLATEHLLRLKETFPDDNRVGVQLAEVYGGLAEQAMMRGASERAEADSARAIALLEPLHAERPMSVGITSRLASQLGLRAGLLQDRGLTGEARAEFEKAVAMLEPVANAAPGEPLAAYRLATLWWQQGRLLGSSGDREREIEQMSRSRELLESLVRETRPDPMSMELALPQLQLRRTLAYLLGDLGHAQQMAGHQERAASAFRAAEVVWRGLVDHENDSEHSEGLKWCLQRIADLGVDG